MQIDKNTGAAEVLMKMCAAIIRKIDKTEEESIQYQIKDRKRVKKKE